MANKSAGETELAHCVFFTLDEASPTARQRLIAACQRYLTGHPGEVSFSVGTVSDLARSVNELDFDVALHIVFESRAAHDAYQIAPRHLQFIEENKADWKKVRVFDSNLEPS